MSSSSRIDRFSFSNIPEALEIPDLIDVQTESFEWFLRHGLKEAFKDISPIENLSGNLSLELEFDPDDEDLCPPPKYSEVVCRQQGRTYQSPIFVRARFLNSDTGEIKEQTVFMGDFPKMTERGSFVINGTERVVVSQLVRSPGAIFQPGRDHKTVFSGTIHPYRGEWIEFDIEQKEKQKLSNGTIGTYTTAGARIARKRRVGIFVLLRALGYTDEAFLSKFVSHFHFLDHQWEKEGKNFPTREDALMRIYELARPGEPKTLGAAEQYFHRAYFDPKRYDLTRVGRYKLNRKLGDEIRKNAELFGIDLELPEDDQVILSRSEILAAVTYLLNIALEQHENHSTYRIDDQDHFANRRIRSVGELIQNQLRVGLSRMERVVRERMSTQDVEAITPQSLINIRPVVAAMKEFFGTSQLSQFMDEINPLSSLAHKRRLSALGPGGLSRERAGFEVRDVHSSHYGRMCPIETPEGPNIGLIGALATYARVNEYGFIETPYRKVVNGRVTNEIVYYDAADEEDFIIAQANAPVDAKGNFTEPRVLVRRGPMGTGVLVGQDRNVRGTTSEIDYVLPTEVDLIDVSPKQIISVSTALIPFVEHDDANRALMGANMQKQAVPLLVPEAPFVGTGVEAYAAEGAKSVILAEGDGEVVYSDAEKIEIKYGKDQVDRYGKKLGTKVYRPRIFESSDDSSMTARTNQGTSLHFRVRVDEGQTVKRGDVLADGPSTDRGDLALGKNLLVAFMPWEGYNYEDAIILSERLVRDDVLTSVHIESYEVDARDTKLGDEEITRDIPNVSESVLANLDDAGIIRVGSEVGPGDVLVGKVTPKGETEQTPEERLLRAIFGEKAREVRDTSLKVPHGSGGIVINVSHTSRAKGDELAPGVNDFVEVFVAQRRKIGVGDKLAGRHGNKGVISKILPEEDMPYLEDGTPVDIILNPLGVPSRMNVGQVLESHLGYAARHGWKGLKDSVNPNAGTSGKGDVARRTRPRTEPAKWVATPAFDGAHWDEKEKSGNLPTIQELFTTLNPDSSTGKVLMGNDGKVTLYNGRTGLPYDNKISVGYVYILKLNHLVDDKIHARSTGPYSMITQQPLGGKAQFGGQRFGEMEVWALEAYGAAYALQELLTIKSDDVSGRVSVYEAIVTGKNIPQPGIPESFKVLIKEMKSLCIDVEVLGRDGAEIKMNEIDEDMIRKAQDLGIDISRHERGSDEEDARREAERQMRNF